MKKYAIVIDDTTNKCDIALGNNTSYFLSEGFTEQEVEKGYDGAWYLAGYAPQPSIEYQNEQIRKQREARFVAESDPLRMDYDEALARGQDNAEELKQTWLASKDAIRADLPYIVEQGEPSPDEVPDEAPVEDDSQDESPVEEGVQQELF